jgi:outer membrane protein insertion porin family
MKKLSLLFLLAVLLNFGLEGIAQTAQPSEPVPCESETPLRPTLRRRQTKPEDQPTAEQQTVSTNADPCDNSSLASGGLALQKPATVRFEGLTAVPEEDFRSRLRDQRFNQSLDSATDSASLAKAEALIKSLLTDYGHRHAEVSSRLEQAGSESPVVTFLINEGPRFTISEIRFEGNRVFSEEILATKMKECLATHDKDRRNVYRPDVFEYCTHLLANFERYQGYLKAKFGEPKVKEVGDGVIITVAVDEGLLYRLGRLEIEGADHVAEQDIRALLDMRKGDIANGGKLAKALYEDLKGVYGEKGFIQYTAEIQPEFHSQPGDTEGVVDFKITVDEGRKFRIRKISFKGDDLPEADLRQLLLLRDGDVYNQKLFEQSINRINETGWFNRVDKDKDVDYRTNEEEKLVDVVIKLSRR